jgi:hypothetical protein
MSGESAIKPLADLKGVCKDLRGRKAILNSSYLSHLEGSVQHVFYNIAMKIRLTSNLFETGMDANDCKFGRDQRLNAPSELN